MHPCNAAASIDVPAGLPLVPTHATPTSLFAGKDPLQLMRRALADGGSLYSAAAKRLAATGAGEQQRQQQQQH
jgi:hypothetical protein